ncbi:MAG TPA: OmpA family protein [Longimicrobiales bacterium]|nr:OmpA family protein [Longimicrobiales bacterium]
MNSTSWRLTGRTLALIVVGATLPGLTACSSMSNTGRGAVIGAAAGGAVGAATGAAAGSTAKGAIIGAAVGGAAGAIIGSQMDDAAEELERDLENAKVERVGEGIQITFDSGILFEFDSSELKDAARANLGELSQSLNEYENYDVLVVGHTDSRGSDDYNLSLSRRRAQAAATYLQSRGIATDRIHVEGLGETEPVASNETDAGRQLNRRVEVAIYASEEYREQLQARHGGG